jgi:hypothetical protein
LKLIPKNGDFYCRLAEACGGLGDLANAAASYREIGINKRFASWINWEIDMLKKQYK